VFWVQDTAAQIRHDLGEIANTSVVVQQSGPFMPGRSEA